MTNIFRYFETPEIREARQLTEDLQRLVDVAKHDQQVAEENLRRKLREAEAHNQEVRDTKEQRLPIAGALVWRGAL